MIPSGVVASPAELMAIIADELGPPVERPLEIYVQIPFCATKCHFCDWVTDIPVPRLRAGADGRRPYLTALVDQIRYYGPLLTRLGYRPHVMYWGGGTPTRLDPAEMRFVREALDESLDLSGLVQWSMETTPNDLSPGKLDAMLELGVDRISVGVQSLAASQLRRAGRGHTREQALAALELLRDRGVPTFNVDLISSFPTDSGPVDLLDTLRGVLPHDPPHISVYPYRATPQTVMAMQLDREVLRAWDVPGMIDAYERAMALLSDVGYHEYCHGYWVRDSVDEDADGNYKYDLVGDKIGFGVGTESILGHHLLLNDNARYVEYLREPRAFSFVQRFSLERPQRLTALVGGALMTRDGVHYERFERLTGLRFEQLRQTPHFASWLALLQECGGRFVADAESFRMDRSVIHRAYITHLAYTMTHGLALGRG
ncbi:radical SAM protein [Micromonospora okii]|uniref:radical SAM protein n=1 Tax=Micromonospora okii TaxID=1182970 RepID=UPI001E5463FD|nr:radical SAM protein [Micromonospora okii]